jgi:hypothetical protein
MTGATGPAGTNGAIGATGTAGTNGMTGATGPAGTNGAQGATGATGPAGTNGATGPAGTNGATGTAGAQGATGAAGANGAAGSMYSALAASSGATLPTTSSFTITSQGTGIVTSSPGIQGDYQGFILRMNVPAVIMTGTFDDPFWDTVVVRLRGSNGTNYLTITFHGDYNTGFGTSFYDVQNSANTYLVQNTSYAGGELFTISSNTSTISVLKSGVSVASIPYVSSILYSLHVSASAGNGSTLASSYAFTNVFMYPIGIAGSNGAQGATGPAGTNGATGAQGPQGATGAAGAAGATGPGTRLVGRDLRNDNETPATWFGRGLGVYTDLKTTSALGIPGGGSFSQVTTYVPWTDSSGGQILQIAHHATNGLTYFRYATGTTTWTQWYGGSGHSPLSVVSIGAGVGSQSITFGSGGNQNTFFNITNSAFSTISTPSGITSAAYAGVFWSFKNSTQSFLSISFTGSGSYGLPNPISVAPSNSIVLTVAPSGDTLIVL